jgi:hypothetical protein
MIKRRHYYKNVFRRQPLWLLTEASTSRDRLRKWPGGLRENAHLWKSFTEVDVLWKSSIKRGGHLRTPVSISINRGGHLKMHASIKWFSKANVLRLRCPPLRIDINRGCRSKRSSQKSIFRDGHLKMTVFINSCIQK